MKTLISFVFVFVISVAALFAADQTWAGSIRDSMCGATHKAAAEHGGQQMSARDCTLACVKNGAKYVFVHSGKAYNIDNQDYAGLQLRAGHSVRLTAAMKGDTITVATIEMPGKKK